MNTLRIAVPVHSDSKLGQGLLDDPVRAVPDRSTRTVRLETPPVSVVKAGDSPLATYPAVLR